MRPDRLQVGQVRGLRLPLRVVHGARDEPTPHHLDIRVSLEGGRGGLRVEVKPDFAGGVPRDAALVVLMDRHEATPPVFVVHRGRVFERGLSLPMVCGEGKVVFWIHAEWPHGEERLAAELRLGGPGAPQPGGRLDTMRLPTIKAVIARMLGPALRVSVVPSLAMLGELMDAPTRAAKARLLEQLAAVGADSYVLEAAVRSIEVAEETAAGFEATDFSSLRLEDMAQACLAIFHSAAPTWVLERAFVATFDRHLEHIVTGSGSSRWKDLTEAAAIAMARRDPALLDEDIRVIAEREGWLPRRLVAHLGRWAKGRAGGVLPTPRPRPLEDALACVTETEHASAVRAVREVLLEYGFIGLSWRAS